MFEWFINVRGLLKRHLPIKMFRSKCHQVYDEWIKQQRESVPEQDQLKEYNIRLRKPNKKYAIKKQDRIIRIT